MRIVRKIITSLRLAVALVPLVAGLAIAAGASGASAGTAPGHTIATAGSFSPGDSTSGGGGAIDFWKVSLNGGDELQLLAAPSVTGTNFTFQLFKPGTTDANFPNAAAFAAGSTGGGSRAVIDLQAPFNGTFVLAVCENAHNSDCVNVDNGSGIDPMDAYTFSTSLAKSVSKTVAAKEVQGSAAIGGAKPLGMGNFEAGGADAIDFWKVSLFGGDRVQLAVTPSLTGTNFTFELFQPGTTDASFPAAMSFSSGSTGGAPRGVIDVMAPFNGTFVLAVCENAHNSDCVNVDNGSGINPMDPYTFTPTLIGGGVKPAVAAKEVRGNPALAGARTLNVGDFDAGGANPVDFWKVPMHGGDRIKFIAVPESGGTNYSFQLFKPGTTDANFPSAVAVASGNTSGGTSAAFDLQAPRSGTYILAVCENAHNSDCRNVDNGSGIDPMDPYTYTSSLVGGLETRTALKLSAVTVVFGHERALRFSATVTARFGGHPAGRVTISDGKKNVCVIKLVNGKGSCFPPKNTTIPVGTYTVDGVYTGSLLSSTSNRVALVVKK